MKKYFINIIAALVGSVIAFFCVKCNSPVGSGLPYATAYVIYFVTYYYYELCDKINKVD